MQIGTLARPRKTSPVLIKPTVYPASPTSSDPSAPAPMSPFHVRCLSLQTTMTFVARHPRYVSLLTLTLLASTFLLLWTRSSPVPSNVILDCPYASKALNAYLRDEEVLYKDALQEREAMVRKWGPKAEDIAMFPESAEFYTLWDFFISSYQCPHRVARIGTLGDGGKWFCGLGRIARQQAPCVVYSFGINGESSFEAELLRAAPKCQVWGYDYSVSSFGPEIKYNLSLRGRSHFYPYALAGEDAPHDDPPRYTLQTLMQKNGHKFIDVLKIDIEGAEFESLTSLVHFFTVTDRQEDGRHPHKAYQEPVLPIGQLQLEIHARGQNGVSFAAFKKWWEMLESAGLRPFAMEPNLVYVNIVRGVRPDLAEYSFINVRGRHALIDESY